MKLPMYHIYVSGRSAKERVVVEVKIRAGYFLVCLGMK